MKVVICPDSFKGTLTALDAAKAMETGVKAAWPDAETVLLPVGDGGEGTVSALAGAMEGAETIRCKTADPLGRDIIATYAIIPGQTALIESAAASGLTLLKPGERDIMKADTYGTGLLIADAIGRGVREIMICMGGTATCDGGYGAYRAISSFLKEKKLPGESVPRLTLLCDVENPMCGAQGAAAVFGPQKGATSEMVSLLDRRLRQLAVKYARIAGVDATWMRHAGAAGGLAGMLMACYGAVPVSGISKVLELLDFDSRLDGADIVLTGEGRADATTLSGKAPSGILAAAAKKGVPVALVCGQTNHRDLLLSSGFAYVEAASPAESDLNPDYARSLAGAVSSLMTRLKK